MVQTGFTRRGLNLRGEASGEGERRRVGSQQPAGVTNGHQGGVASGRHESGFTQTASSDSRVELTAGGGGGPSSPKGAPGQVSPLMTGSPLTVAKSRQTRSSEHSPDREGRRKGGRRTTGGSRPSRGSGEGGPFTNDPLGRQTVTRAGWPEGGSLFTSPGPTKGGQVGGRGGRGHDRSTARCSWHRPPLESGPGACLRPGPALAEAGLARRW